MEWRTLALCTLVLALTWGLHVNAIRARRSNHVDNVCSMWGNFHFKTFDGDVYQFQGICEYNLVSDCHGPVPSFSVHVKRAQLPRNPQITRVLVTIGDVAIDITSNLVMVNGDIVELPHYEAGVLVEQSAVYLKLFAKLGLSILWNRDDAIMVELDTKYANQTCGLCGDFNGIPIYNEFLSEAREIGPIEFGNKYRVHSPNDNCEDPYEEDESAQTTVDKCQAFRAGCSELLENEAWSSCTKILSPEPYIRACMVDRCWSRPGDIVDTVPLCTTLSEYSRQCSHAGGTPPNWRKPKLCEVKCPFNMEYSESGSPCVDTCTHRDTSLLCEEHKMDGCFCPPGTVFDDISKRGCIPQKQCQCKHNQVYNPGDMLLRDDKECVCQQGDWVCEILPTPGACAVEEGSHFTTFDGKEFTFHGDCYYIISKDCEESRFVVLGQLIPCVNRETDTCLKSIALLLNNDKNNALIIKDDGTVRHTGDLTLPYTTANLTVFRPSSFHIMLQTSFGLQMQVQLVPLMQLYITLDHSFQTKTCGLCGNFNMVLSDELKTPQGLVEGTAASFASSWKAQYNCPDRSERLDDPCSYSIDSESYAEHWCTKLKEKGGPFATCHSAVNPEGYYKRCKYSSCTCEKSENCLCAVFSSYVRACTAKGIFMKGWRDTVCGKYTEHCPATQTFSYLLQGCQRTCHSLSLERQGCSTDFVPVDGCACPDGLYENEKGVCVSMDKCSCYHNGERIKPGKSINIRNEHCLCTNGKLSCHAWKALVTDCPAPKVYFNCSEAGPDEHGLECAKTCSSKTIDCYLAGCASGCQCPPGLIDDGRGHCVQENKCPCKHNGHFYADGSKIPDECNTCTCTQGKWVCTEKKCPGSCTIYGSGHYNTFDKQTFGFSGDCDYIAVQNKCGNKTGTFHVITENVPCGTTGTTCSKYVRILLGRIEFYLVDGKIEERWLDSGPSIHYTKRIVGLYMVIESDIGLTVFWDRKTTVRIMLQPQHMGEVCGLCGNYNGNGKDDFTTQGQLQVSNILEFVNSWKVKSDCPDAKPDFDPCFQTPNRHTWAKMQCSIITGNTFKDCHKKVDPKPYYDNCVKDSCACDTGGDCECFCTAVAAYAQACNEAGVCVAWRTPEICPVFCDYYNAPDECTWHYSPCHTPCYKTCLNLEGVCLNPLPNLEGCYPVCPEDKPIFDEWNQICVEECDNATTTTPYTTTTQITTTESTTSVSTPEPTTTPSTPYTTTKQITTTEITTSVSTPEPTTTPSTPYTTTTQITTESTTSVSTPEPTTTPSTPYTTTKQITTTESTTSVSTPEPTTTPSTPYTTTKQITTTESTTSVSTPEPTTTPSTPYITTVTTRETTTAPTTTSGFTSTTEESSSTLTATTTSISTTSPCIICDWSEWFNVYDPNSEDGSDFETYEKIKAAGKIICDAPEDIECRAVVSPDEPFDDLIHATGQVAQCNVSFGLVCEQKEQVQRPFKCLDYEIRVYCCHDICDTSTTTTQITTTESTASVSTTKPTTTPSTPYTTTTQIKTTESTASVSTPKPTTTPSTPYTTTTQITTTESTASVSTPKPTTIPSTPYTTTTQITTTESTASVSTPKPTTTPSTPYTTTTQITTTESTASVSTPKPTTTPSTPYTTTTQITTTESTASVSTPKPTTTPSTPYTTTKQITTTESTASVSTPKLTTTPSTPYTTTTQITTTESTASVSTPKPTTTPSTPYTTTTQITTTESTASVSTPKPTTTPSTPYTTTTQITTTESTASVSTPKPTTTPSTPYTTTTQITTTESTASVSTPKPTTTPSTPYTTTKQITTTESTASVSTPKPTTTPSTPYTTTTQITTTESTASVSTPKLTTTPSTPYTTTTQITTTESTASVSTPKPTTTPSTPYTTTTQITTTESTASVSTTKPTTTPSTPYTTTTQITTTESTASVSTPKPTTTPSTPYTTTTQITTTESTASTREATTTPSTLYTTTTQITTTEGTTSVTTPEPTTTASTPYTTTTQITTTESTASTPEPTTTPLTPYTTTTQITTEGTTSITTPEPTTTPSTSYTTTTQITTTESTASTPEPTTTPSTPYRTTPQITTTEGTTSVSTPEPTTTPSTPYTTTTQITTSESTTSVTTPEPTTTPSTPYTTTTQITTESTASTPELTTTPSTPYITTTQITTTEGTTSITIPEPTTTPLTPYTTTTQITTEGTTSITTPEPTTTPSTPYTTTTQITTSESTTSVTTPEPTTTPSTPYTTTTQITTESTASTPELTTTPSTPYITTTQITTTEGTTSITIPEPTTTPLTPYTTTTQITTEGTTSITTPEPTTTPSTPYTTTTQITTESTASTPEPTTTPSTPYRTTTQITTTESITSVSTPEPTTTPSTPYTTTTQITTTESTASTPEPTTTPSTPYRTTTQITTTEGTTSVSTPEPTTTPSTPYTTTTQITTTQSTASVSTPEQTTSTSTTTTEKSTTSSTSTTTIPATTTTTPATTTTTPTTASTPTLTTPKHGCPTWDVGTNETFEICNCTLARCIEDNIIEIIPYECPPLQNITCSNRRNPVEGFDEYQCCKEYVCDCFCEGWGDPHYITFDGLFYSHQGNCTYVLMEEIRPKHNLKIYIDNVNCDPREHVSCPRALIVSYNKLIITLKNNNLIGAAKLQALKGNVVLPLPFVQNGVRVLGSGVNLILEIPQLGVVVTFGVTGFSVFLPFQHFGKNTQGHCGTCNNNQADDCMLPDGKLVNDCAVMADYWPAKDLYDVDCPAPTSIPTAKPCPINPVCDLLNTDVFKKCHPYVSPDNYFKGCQFDSCHMTNPAAVCTSLQTYALACSQFGICLHWRNYTDLCTVECLGDKVYKPCGPAEPPTCEDRPNEHTLNVTIEGCFCPDGTLLFNKDSGLCVDKCGCLDASGQAREPGEKFQLGCQDCLCDASTTSVICKPKQCSNNNQITCSEPGFIVVNETDPSDKCCTILACRCDSNSCPSVDGKCNIGYAPVLQVPEGQCCPKLTCEPKKVCVHKNIEYEPGTSVPVVDCQECQCTWDVDPKTQLFLIRCGFVTCDETCEPGYEYVETVSDECCGKCVQSKCILNLNGTRHLLQSGAEWAPSKYTCERYTCTNIGGEFVTTHYKIQCPPFNIDNCQPGTVQLSADDCCQVCVEKEKGCKVETISDYILHDSCQSENQVEQTHCAGDCNSYSKYSQLGSSSCSCCQAARSSNRTVTLKCLNGDVVPHSYVYVEECNCSQTKCLH
ncbi:mucin-2 isoform X4 [Pygocentrus nattereri]|uniref:mucin-2 isoform X4 n=1 Tax=Pygocentrus nattereri TaxID=42514 RepID=UPI0018916733|nr:mucin-2 isoform X4 [Pygocentrus nattereri]